MRLRLLLDLEMDRFGVALDFLDSLDNFIFKYFLSVFNFLNTFVHFGLGC